MYVSVCLLTLPAWSEDVADCKMLHRAYQTCLTLKQPWQGGAPYVAAFESTTSPNSAGREQLTRLKCSRHEVRAMHQECQAVLLQQDLIEANLYRLALLARLAANYATVTMSNKGSAAHTH